MRTAKRNPATGLVTTPPTKGAPRPAGAKPTSPGQRPGNSVHSIIPSPERAEQTTLPEGWQIRRLGELLCEVDVRQADLAESEARELNVLSLTKKDSLILQSARFGKRIATDDTSKYKSSAKGRSFTTPT
jgi:hypothetical protein